MLQDPRISLFLLAELVAALRANDPDLFKRWLYGGIEDLGEPAVTELLLDWLDPFLTEEEQDRLLGWHLGESLESNPSLRRHPSTGLPTEQGSWRTAAGA